MILTSIGIHINDAGYLIPSPKIHNEEIEKNTTTDEFGVKEKNNSTHENITTSIGEAKENITSEKLKIKKETKSVMDNITTSIGETKENNTSEQFDTKKEMKSVMENITTSIGDGIRGRTKEKGGSAVVKSVTGGGGSRFCSWMSTVFGVWFVILFNTSFVCGGFS